MKYAFSLFMSGISGDMFHPLVLCRLLLESHHRRLPVVNDSGQLVGFLCASYSCYYSCSQKLYKTGLCILNASVSWLIWESCCFSLLTGGIAHKG